MINFYIQKFFELYNGGKITFVAAGGCASLARLLQVPGSSGFINGIYLPYSDDSINKIKASAGYKGSAVSAEFAKILSSMYARKCIGITCSLITNRIQKSANQAFIYDSYNPSILSSNSMHIKFSKYPDRDIKRFSDMIRLRQDMIVGIVVLAYLCRFSINSEFLYKLKNYEPSLEEISLT